MSDAEITYCQKVMKKYKIKIHNPVLGVPITFLDSFDPDQFSIVAFRKGTDGKDLVYTVERESRMLQQSANCKIPQSLTYIPGFLCGKSETYILTMLIIIIE